ncbi:hypothetical protein GA0116948_104141 [Chitinophaga costaii]|uniref:Uncharacterized protein n=1 Tax=Chitinophaga costaii TaxID=1335309 RepID=A0A1C4CIG8_9BACT|nr:hypothetical protein GA0116948_104141 [Chitinophaga costaii]
MLLFFIGWYVTRYFLEALKVLLLKMMGGLFTQKKVASIYCDLLIRGMKHTFLPQIGCYGTRMQAPLKISFVSYYCKGLCLLAMVQHNQYLLAIGAFKGYVG